MFVDRVRELELLEEAYRSDRAELFVLYGRRRVGKTELLAEFCRGKRHIFFVADLDTEARLLANLSAAVNTVLLGKVARSLLYPDWDSLFRVVADHSSEQRLVLVLDEFPYLATAHPPLPSILQRAWDRTLSRTRLMLVLSGSSIGMMESTVLGYRAPLYGRRTRQYLLEPLSFHDARRFFAGLARLDQVRAYAILGGTPAYLRIVHPRPGLKHLVRDQVLERGTFLYDEVRFLLQQELREPRNYFAILEAIATGRSRLNEIKQAAGLEGVSAYLGTLQELHLVERIVPVTETRPDRSRLGVYRLRDPFLRFWFRFVHPNRTALERGAASGVLKRKVWPVIDHFTAQVFEEICRQYVWRLALEGGLSFPVDRVGSWWRGGEEIDVVAVGDEILIGECKWSSSPVGTDILRQIEARKAALEVELSRRVSRVALFSRTGFTPAVREERRRRRDLLLCDLPDIVEGRVPPGRQ